MRLLVDEHFLTWDDAWHVTSHTFGYTNHTLLPEALEKWPVDLFAGLLPRHIEIVYEINRRFLEVVRDRFPGDEDRATRLSLIDESPPRSVRMAHLAAVGSHAINGVARLHSDLLQATVMRDFHALWPDRFSNKTNGVTPRRFLFLSNPRLCHLITSGALAHGDPERFRPLVESLCRHDGYFVLADFPAYVAAQEAVHAAYADPARWTRMSILNVARVGYFSSDRAIREYCTDIWKVGPLRVDA